MPEAPEVKWVFMVVVIGALYMSKTKTNNGRISQPSRNATLVARQPRGIQAYAPILGLDEDRTKEFNLMKSMTPDERKAYLASRGITMGDK